MIVLCRRCHWRQHRGLNHWKTSPESKARALLAAMGCPSYTSLMTLAVAAEDVTAIVVKIRKQGTGPASVNAVARELGLSRSTAHRRLQEAVQQGLLTVLGPAGYFKAPK